MQNAVNDAKKLIEILREKHKYQVWVCLDEVATHNNLNNLLEQTLPRQVKPDDRLLFYFAGHGIALNGEDGPTGYLIPQDAILGDTQTYLPMTKLQKCLESLSCRHFLGILDCCFAGAFRWSSTRDLLTAPEVIHKERYERFITDPAWQVITSAASDQKASDALYLNTERGQKGNHSPFLWNANPRLDLLKKISKSDDNWLNQVEAEFVLRSIDRKTFNTRRNWGIAIAVMLGLGTGLVFSLIGQRNALIGQIQASQQAAEANLQSGQDLEGLTASLRAAKSLRGCLESIKGHKDRKSSRDCRLNIVSNLHSHLGSHDFSLHYGANK